MLALLCVPENGSWLLVLLLMLLLPLYHIPAFALVCCHVCLASVGEARCRAESCTACQGTRGRRSCRHSTRKTSSDRGKHKGARHAVTSSLLSKGSDEFDILISCVFNIIELSHTAHAVWTDVQADVYLWSKSYSTSISAFSGVRT